MKAYIASFFANKDVVQKYGEELKAVGIEPTMRWPLETAPHNATIKDFPDEYFRETASFDLDDIIEADVLMMLIPSDTQLVDAAVRSMSRGGRHFETGFFYAMLFIEQLMGVRILGRKAWTVDKLMVKMYAPRELILVGPRENVFHFLDGLGAAAVWPAIKQFDTWEQASVYVQSKKAALQEGQ